MKLADYSNFSSKLPRLITSKKVVLLILIYRNVLLNFTLH